MQFDTRYTKTIGIATAGALALIAVAAGIGGCFPKLETRTPAKQAAALAPEFELPDSSGEVHRLSDLIAEGPAVVVFYRGYW